MTESRNQHEHALESALAPGWPERANICADELRNVYRELDGLAAGQRSLLDANRIDDLLDLLTRRRGLIDRIQELSEGLQPVIEDWEQLGASVPEPVRSTLENAIAEIYELNEGILARDHRDTEVLVGQKDRVAQSLGAVDKGRAAVNAYSGGDAKRQGPAYFQDRQG